jgi:acetyl esterase/lipase
LTGQRYHDRPMKEWFVSELRESLATSAHDVQMVLNYLASRGDMDMKRVGMFGDGSGASIAILAAAVDARIRTLDLQDPWGDWPDWIKESKRIPENERAAYLKPEWLSGVAPLDPVKWLPQLKTQKIRIQFVKDVSVTPADVQQKIEAAVPTNAQVVHYDNIAAFRAAVAGGTEFDWIKQKMHFSVVPDFSAVGQEQQIKSGNAKDMRQ